MNFIAPLFFAALAGLAIPVLLHLTQREKKQIIRFPSLMFVRRIPYQSVRRRKIQHWLLLLVRVTALALIVLAFARPFVRQANVPVVPGAVVPLIATAVVLAPLPRKSPRAPPVSPAKKATSPLSLILSGKKKPLA